MEAFERFTLERKADLQRIARHTRGDSTYGDVVNEAWLMGRTLSDRHRIPVDFLDPAFQAMLLGHLYQHLVRYTELTVRHAVRLDHAPGGNAGQEAPHPLLNRLAGDDGENPLCQLVAMEDAPAPPSSANTYHSLASAYLLLLRHYDNRMRGVANHLLISTSHAYRCCAMARWRTTFQHALELAPPASMAMMKPLRRQRAWRTPRQLAFDFDEKLPLTGPPPA